MVGGRVSMSVSVGGLLLPARRVVVCVPRFCLSQVSFSLVVVSSAAAWWVGVKCVCVSVGEEEEEEEGSLWRLLLLPLLLLPPPPVGTKNSMMRVI